MKWCQSASGRGRLAHVPGAARPLTQMPFLVPAQAGHDLGGTVAEASARTVGGRSCSLPSRAAAGRSGSNIRRP